ncbi:hypothetical protein [Lysobacter hankyongensis]|uniref:Permease n=1 Tax=Lysobacter hankyongensis TaxID=1176535 RepID=A0ABP9BU04_9GAMM
MTGKPTASPLVGLASHLLQFLPLSGFLLVAFRHGAPGLEDWLIAFMAGGAIAVLQVLLTLAFARGRPLNRMLLGVNAYLVVGGFSALTNQLWILQSLNDLRESGLFLCILAVGVLTTLGTPAGFVGREDRSGAGRTARYSWVLLALAAIATIPSFLLREQLLYSAVIPLTVLSMLHRRLGNRIETS